MRDHRTHAIIGAATEVHRQLDSGFQESVYREALAIEFTKHSISHSREAGLPVHCNSRALSTHFLSAFVCFESVIVELKPADALGGAAQAQMLNYLRATGLDVGLLLNFGAKSLDYRRFVGPISV